MMRYIKILIFTALLFPNISVAQSDTLNHVFNKFDLDIDSLNKEQKIFLNNELSEFITQVNRDNRLLLNPNFSSVSIKSSTFQIENTVQQFIIKIDEHSTETIPINHCKTNKLFEELVKSKINSLPREQLDFWSYDIINSIKYEGYQNSINLLFHIDSHGFISNFYIF